MSKTIIYKNSTNKDANKGTNNNKDISRILVWFYLNARKIKILRTKWEYILLLFLFKFFSFVKMYVIFYLAIENLDCLI